MNVVGTQMDRLSQNRPSWWAHWHSIFDNHWSFWFYPIFCWFFSNFCLLKGHHGEREFLEGQGSAGGSEPWVAISSSHWGPQELKFGIGDGFLLLGEAFIGGELFDAKKTAKIKRSIQIHDIPLGFLGFLMISTPW